MAFYHCSVMFVFGSGKLLQMAAIKTALFHGIIKGLAIMELQFTIIWKIKNIPNHCKWFDFVCFLF